MTLYFLLHINLTETQQPENSLEINNSEGKKLQPRDLAGRPVKFGSVCDQHTPCQYMGIDL